MSAAVDLRYVLAEAANLDAGADRRSWVATLPEGDLLALVDPETGERTKVTVTPEQLAEIKASFDEYMRDLAAIGTDYKRPVIVEHRTDEYADELRTRVEFVPQSGELGVDRDGRRSGDILAAEVRPYDHRVPGEATRKAVPTLFLLVDWREDAWKAIHEQRLEHVSIHVKPAYTDPETGKTYKSFVFELTETVIPVVKRFSIRQTLSRDVAAGLGLRLADSPPDAEERMTPEEIAQAVAMAVSEALAPLQESLGAINEKLDGLTAADDDEEEVMTSDDPAAEPVVPEPVGETPAGMEAVLSEMRALKAQVSKGEEARKRDLAAFQKTLQLSAAGNAKGGPATPPADPKTEPKADNGPVTEDEAEALALAELKLSDFDNDGREWNFAISRRVTEILEERGTKAA